MGYTGPIQTKSKFVSYISICTANIKFHKKLSTISLKLLDLHQKFKYCYKAYFYTLLVNGKKILILHTSLLITYETNGLSSIFQMPFVCVIVHK